MQAHKLSTGDFVRLAVRENARKATTRNHSATHILHHILRSELGDHVMQKGSLVTPDKLRFDFAHHEALSPEQLQGIEAKVNDVILTNASARAKECSIDEARADGALALFGEKYGETVRVIQLGDSVELCGGTHVGTLAEIGSFRILSESALSAGVRRIEAVTGSAANDDARAEAEILRLAAQNLGCAKHDVANRIDALNVELKQLRKDLKSARDRERSAAANTLLDQSVTLQGVQVLALRADEVESKELKGYADQLRDKLGSGIVVLGKANGSKSCTILVGVTKDLTGHYHAGRLVSSLAQIVGGKGGGKPDMAQAGGKDVDALDKAIARARSTAFLGS